MFFPQRQKFRTCMKQESHDGGGGDDDDDDDDNDDHNNNIERPRRHLTSY